MEPAQESIHCSTHIPAGGHRLKSISGTCRSNKVSSSFSMSHKLFWGRCFRGALGEGATQGRCSDGLGG